MSLFIGLQRPEIKVGLNSCFSAIQLTILCCAILSGLTSSAQINVHEEDFSTGLGSWTAIDLGDDTDVWNSSSGYVEMNGYGGSNDEDWLISPSIDMDAQDHEHFLFDYNDYYDGDFIELYYSSDFNGVMNPANVSAATWTKLDLVLTDIYVTTCFSSLFHPHPAIDVSGVLGTEVYFAFRYTSLSTSAKRYRLDNIHIESEYYSAVNLQVQAGLNCAPLKTELHRLMNNQTDRIRYSSSLYDVWDAILHTDTRLNDAGTDIIVKDRFTDFPVTMGEFEFDHCNNRDNGSCPGGEGICYNREHTFPRSWWGGSTTLNDTQYVDMHHIVPSDRAMNSVKSNYPPGEVITPTSTGSNGFRIGTNPNYPCASMRYFEPIDEYKGDYARMFFYMATRYENYMVAWETNNTSGNCAMSGNTYPSYENWMIDVLLQWHANDPVSQVEMDRNDAVYAIQGNRNAFIDNPNWTNLVWGDENGIICSLVPLPIELLSFNAKLRNGKVLLDWVTGSEVNNDFFSVERSKYGYEWDEVLREDGAGNSSSIIVYEGMDQYPMEGISYYRLKQTDYNGEYSYSDVRVIDNEGQYASSLKVYPNPTEGTLYIKGLEKDEELRLYSSSGRLIRADYLDIMQDGGGFRLDLSALTDDLYLIWTAKGTARILKR